MEDSIIAWNPANWITVFLMGLAGFVFIGMVARIIQQRRSNQAAA